MKQLSLVLVWLAGLVLAGCDDGQQGATPVRTAVVRSTTSFGFCIGYCRSTLEITPGQARYRLVDERTQRPDLERTVAITMAEWQALESAVNRRQLEALPPVIGCPDCADGGAESLEVVGEGWSRSVTFEYEARLPELQPLLDRVRAIRTRLDRELRPSE